ncbi:ATP-dependent Lhr-like helicase [Maritimibacter alkaliphilus HTCC2654]|uniref:ATP-dependent helicase, DEAD/DEAH box family protein n=1 Tax=Maritimibacter alkaliphilus HTCC2654 TaxID=314271 RepID=A3VKL2_9RHOB|nr:ligase-associated DNA damage response DEXH box helicase [Maritimibacter alkaliphilus]EAQ11183.1 ATP-dependent helicase, DEAD/DEAH box family protein [Rhodobacterales bacterium HTCC2654] [Maritimibacter alkaliphilus HTCC2654]TYP82991.1 ATP-dependent Lhr-like helicase [Maritimibacter alkaliphilus HTCC2654]
MSALPPIIADWFTEKGWSVHPHQLEMLARGNDPATLLVAPTGGGKTLAGFLPTLVELAEHPRKGLHTLYISPLKALAADMRRNLTGPIDEMGLPIRVEDRSGDTTQTRKKAQRADPPEILLTTPESLALLLSYEDAPRMFAGLERVVVDELHALAESKRGDQLMLCLARLVSMRPDLRRVGLSATVEDPPALARFFMAGGCPVLTADPGPDPDIRMLTTQTPPPWSGGGGAYAIPDVLEEVKRHKTTLIFHNTRAQAEIFFHNLWLANEEGLPIGIHHGSLAREQRQKVEAAMVAGELRAIVCTGTLDLGLDWGDVDLVIQIGAPKNVKRLVQRIGRANHRYNAPSKALLLPANRWEVIECQAALEAVLARDLDGDPRGPGPRDVLCQHILIVACSGPFDEVELFNEVRRAGGYAGLTRAQFDEALDFVATGGYALRAYDRWQRLKQRPDGLWQLRDPRAAALVRMNIGTIQDTDTLKVRMRQNRKFLGEVEEGFAASLIPGDTFLMGGKIVRFESLKEMHVDVTNDKGRKPKIAVFAGSKFATSTQLSARVLDLIHRRDLSALPSHTQDWIALQREVSHLPEAGRILVESFPHDGRAQTAIYGFAGRGAMQTLGLLLTRRMETAGLGPLGFVATDYATLIWSLHPVDDPAFLFSRDDLVAGLEGWLSENALMKRSFKAVANIAGLTPRNFPGTRASGRQATFSSDILYDTLRRYDPDHLLLNITREEAMRGLIDFGRIEEMLERTEGRVDHMVLDRVTPFAAPLFLEVGKVPVDGMGREALMEMEAERLMQEAGLA